MKEQVIQSFRDLYHRDPTIVVRAPGRVNLLGEHVDYNEGWVLPAAIDRAVWLAAAPTDNGLVRISALDFGREGETDLASLREIGNRPPAGSPDLSWLNYPAGVAWAMQNEGHTLSGMEAVFTSDIPIGAGVSSSAAVEVAFIRAWEALSGLSLSGKERALLGQKVENDYLGLASGIMDQFASVHGAANQLVLLDCRSLQYEHIPLPDDTIILVVDSGVRRELAHSEYNIRRQQCTEAVAILQQYLPATQALRDVGPEEFELYAHRLPPLLRRRARHVVTECVRVLESVEALRQGNLGAFGRLIRHSHISLRDLYEVSILQLDVLAAAAWQTPGCYGARLTGAGFGGCVIALVDKGAAESVAESMAQAFAAEFDHRPGLFACEVSAGVALLPVGE